MVFSSVLFLFRFLPIVLALYYISPRRLKNAVLFFASLVFYAWGEPVYVCLMLFSTIFNYTLGILLDICRTKEKKSFIHLIVFADVFINLLILGYFKYSDFIISNINSLLNVNIPLVNLALPIGISFYTFQTMSYIIDVYRNNSKVQKNFISFGAYVALFPQLIAGPIVRYNTIAKQLDNRRESFEHFSYGVRRFVIGMGKKVLLANNIGLLWNSIFVGEINKLPVATAWIGAFAFTFQIYFDFSGYSDMAIGLGRMFGFEFLENFNYPYESKSITEFWRRWHISLGTWFREYVYIPLGGNKCSKIKQLRNIAIVWILTGIWHGADWNFAIWGIYFGILIVLEKLFLGKLIKKLPDFLQRIYTMLLIIISWVIFANNSLTNVLNYIKSMFGINNNQLFDTHSLYLICTYVLIFIILVFASTSIPKKVGNFIMKKLSDKVIIETICENVFLIIVIVLSVAFLVNATYNPFLYFRF